LADVAFMFTKTPEKHLENGIDPQLFITNSSVVHYERSKRLYRTTDFFEVYQYVGKHNYMDSNALRSLSKISNFANNFSEALKYSILRAYAPRDFNN